MQWYKVLVNHAELDSIQAANAAEARKLARAMYGRRCDVIGGR